MKKSPKKRKWNESKKVKRSQLSKSKPYSKIVNVCLQIYNSFSIVCGGNMRNKWWHLQLDNRFCCKPYAIRWDWDSYEGYSPAGPANTCILLLPFSFLILHLPTSQSLLNRNIQRLFESGQAWPFSRRDAVTPGLEPLALLGHLTGCVRGVGCRGYPGCPLLPVSDLGPWVPGFLPGEDRGPGMQAGCSQHAPRSHRSTAAKDFHTHCLKS